ncbi:membrane-associated tyrosine- and threonine-specific cdc2-inhibitory kinase [Sabethes cyaneus]|uniref:membrane-associated tyrosine- and threonine-specific cdc2-inhibitory kinase n=1 Tax=Sabethes cyaneus TaxID=53552 RepID=UPI00237E2092|nr:membrane-associated tyrosine- and threonine-specific cdc2-inhibitory kinase [Sabethes cyaneus]XP_053695101.1 membrane-associated tyrosine- and threonine-specific cdc2-inhibitory kinase [Sabethes cyaneus]
MRSPLPVPEFLEENNLSLSFKEPHRKNRVQRPPKPPKLHSKVDTSFSRASSGSQAAHAISFRSDRSELSSLYQHNKRESYYEQCFEQITKVGEGSFGEVFKVKSKQDGCFYAIKKSKEFFRGENYRQERLEEVRRYEQFSEHENCVRLCQAWEQDDRLYMQMELCKGNLEDYVREQRFIPEDKIWSILLDLLLGLKSLHDRNLIHLDIKLDNILITDDGVCKLADFGLVLDLNSRNFQHASEGDSRYIAPELLEGKYTKAVDIFSLGIAILELSCNLELPPNGPLWQSLRSGALPAELLCRLSNELQYVIQWMMCPEPKSRPSVNALLKFPKIASLYRARRRWRLLRSVRSYLNRKLCNLRFFLTTLVISFVSCLRLRHAKPSLPQKGYRNNHKQSSASGINDTSVRTSLINHFGDESDEDLISSTCGDLDLTGGSGGSGIQITPTLNNSVPTHTPTIRILNSTPLNHNHAGSRLRFRNHTIDTPFANGGSDEDLSFTIDYINKSQRMDEQNTRLLHSSPCGSDSSFLTKKKLFFKSDDSD